MLIIKPYIFNRFPEITYGFSTKIGAGRKAPYYFNMSFAVGDDENKVTENRKLFFQSLGLNEKSVAYQKQVHGDKITVVSSAGNCGESDAMITAEPNLGLAVSTADCCGIFIYDAVKKVIAGVHSGWRGTVKKILMKTLNKLKEDFDCNPENLICYISPAISQQNYPVGKEVTEQFESKFVLEKNGKCYLNIPEANYVMLQQSGVKEHNIQVSNLCTFEYAEILHSYRRDGQKSGRALGLITMKERK